MYPNENRSPAKRGSSEMSMSTWRVKEVCMPPQMHWMGHQLTVTKPTENATFLEWVKESCPVDVLMWQAEGRQASESGKKIVVT
jgi:hypothetical protein